MKHGCDRSRSVPVQRCIVLGSCIVDQLDVDSWEATHVGQLQPREVKPHVGVAVISLCTVESACSHRVLVTSVDGSIWLRRLSSLAIWKSLPSNYVFEDFTLRTWRSTKALLGSRIEFHSDTAVVWMGLLLVLRFSEESPWIWTNGCCTRAVHMVSSLVFGRTASVNAVVDGESCSSSVLWRWLSAQASAAQSTMTPAQGRKLIASLIPLPQYAIAKRVWRFITSPSASHMRKGYPLELAPFLQRMGSIFRPCAPGVSLYVGMLYLLSVANASSRTDLIALSLAWCFWINGDDARADHIRGSE